ncbi:unnamed protein product [Mytilus edulis]|uniref:Uncharacterized protein n=1 Tax=Mytilus edulis TaxID=6550 RepID=A0A8S3RS91_MYTED|nr:unnamed protein product [Mytilus edulis]
MCVGQRLPLGGRRREDKPFMDVMNVVNTSAYQSALQPTTQKQNTVDYLVILQIVCYFAGNPTVSSEMPSKVPKRSNRKRKSTQRLGEVMENIGSSDLERVYLLTILYQALQIQIIIPASLVTIFKSTGVIQGRDVISPDPTLIPTHQGVNSICPPRQDTSRCNTTEMTTPSQSHSTNIIDNQSFESSHPSCSNVISWSGQQCFMPTEGSLSQQVANHLLQGTPNIDTFSNELG